MDTTYDFNATEIIETEPPVFYNTSESDPDALECITCHKPITYGGRGPKPKYCEEHKKRKTTSTKAKTGTKRKTGTDYTQGIMGILQLPAAALGILGSQTNKEGQLTRPEFLADAAVITKYAPDIATAVSDLANDQPQVAAVLDRVLKAGPYGALIGAVLPMAAQLLSNHNVIPSGLMGTKSVNQVLQEAMEEAARNDG